MRKLSTRQRWLLAVAVIAVLAIVVFIFWPVRSHPTDNTEKYLERQNDSLIKANKNAQTQLDRSQKVIDSLLAIINDGESKIQKIYINVEKTIHTYDTLSPVQIERILSKRYGKN